MTWGELKQQAEQQGVEDNTEINMQAFGGYFEVLSAELENADSQTADLFILRDHYDKNRHKSA